LTIAAADTYYISCKITTVDAEVIEDRLYLSKAMLQDERRGRPICRLDGIFPSIAALRKSAADRVCDCLLRAPHRIRSWQTNRNAIIEKDLQELLLPPRKIWIENEDGEITLYHVCR